MPIHIQEKAIEGSSFEASIDWVDENGDAVVPTAMAWTLMDGKGNIINSRDAVSISTPASTEVLLLEGDDLKCSGENSPVRRWIYWNGTYTSTTHGAGKPLVDISSFDILPIIQPRT
jgi:hypothetical protein